MNETATMVGGFFFLGIAGLLILVAFLILRALALWYWRVNDAIRLLEKIDVTLDGIERSTRKTAELGTSASRERTPPGNG